MRKRPFEAVSLTSSLRSSFLIPFRCGKSGCILVTDAMAAMGLPDGDYTLGSMGVKKEEGKAVLKGTEVGSLRVGESDEAEKHAHEI